MIALADLEKLARFLVKAKIVTYASGNDEITKKIRPLKHTINKRIDNDLRKT